MKFKEHQGSKCHRAAVTNEVIVSQCASVAEMMNEKEKGQHGIKPSLFNYYTRELTISCAARVSIAWNDDETSNFYQLLKLRAKFFPKLEEWLDKKRGKYVAHDKQNEKLKIMSNSIVIEILDDVRGNMFSVMADEYTDVSNKEQLIFCL